MHCRLNWPEKGVDENWADVVRFERRGYLTALVLSRVWTAGDCCDRDLRSGGLVCSLT